MLKLVDISAILDILLQVSDISDIVDILDILWQPVLYFETSRYRLSLNSLYSQLFIYLNPKEFEASTIIHLDVN